jgi:hypothetical protein
MYPRKQNTVHTLAEYFIISKRLVHALAEYRMSACNNKLHTLACEGKILCMHLLSTHESNKLCIHLLKTKTSKDTIYHEQGIFIACQHHSEVLVMPLYMQAIKQAGHMSTKL